MTVIGPEDIEAEIVAINTGREVRGRPAMPSNEQAAYRQERLAEMNNAIVGIRLREKRP